MSCCIVQCYAPTDPDDVDVKDAFYSQLEQVVGSLHKGEINLVMGDFNAQVGSDNTNLEKVLGRNGMGRRTDNGERLIEMCTRNNLVIGGTLFPHLDIHKCTWTSPRGSRSQLDHICINSKWRQCLLDVRTRRGADVFTGHELLMVKL